MRMMTSEEENRLVQLERQVEALLVGREHMGIRIMRLRDFIDRNCRHSGLEDDCPTCLFLQKDAE